jgi:hypothetical protein
MSYIMQVTERVDVQDVGEAGSDEKILQETGEHVPWIALSMKRQCHARQTWNASWL